ncbi:toxin-antitoxin system HicB family antitoxin [Acidaminococcus sp. HCP3S3_G9_1]|uniref:toxin-antitoxin system HicB family antitoxin n=1 Tax=Acidaminococcus sp. HCP3S3_G9_1 TaxID=3438732 RepID=UPI003F914F57
MDKDIKYYMALPYQEILEPEENGYLAYIPLLKGCEGQGPTEAEALKALEMKKKEWLEERLEKNEEIPEPLTLEQFSGRFALRMPKSLHRKISLLAKEEGVSLNQMIVYLISCGINHLYKS